MGFYKHSSHLITKIFDSSGGRSILCKIFYLKDYRAGHFLKVRNFKFKNMNIYCVTFGQQYRSEPHPKVKYAHPDGWLAIEANSEVEARDKAFAHLGREWSSLYEESKFEKHYFPLGELHRLYQYY